MKKSLFLVITLSLFTFFVSSQIKTDVFELQTCTSDTVILFRNGTKATKNIKKLELESSHSSAFVIKGSSASTNSSPITIASSTDKHIKIAGFVVTDLSTNRHLVIVSIETDAKQFLVDLE